MIYCKTENGIIVEVFETDNQELAELNGFTTPCEREIVRIHDGSYKFADETTEEDFLPTLEEVKQDKIAELKSIRDEKEVEDILVSGHLFDYDDKARERINAAIIALDVTQGTIMWTLADNTDTEVSANDLRFVIAMVAQRSNVLHVKYRMLKEQVNEAQTREEVEAIVWGD